MSSDPTPAAQPQVSGTGVACTHAGAASAPAADAAGPGAVAPPRRRGRLRAVWNGVVGVIGGVVGLVPHVLHHLGFLAGTALVAGAAGTALFGAVGLAASVPFLLRLRRRFGTWRAPAIALAVFAAMFSISTFMIGPAISGGGGDTEIPQAPPAADTPGHDEHH